MRTITPRYEELVAEARAAVRTYSPGEAMDLLGDERVLFVDVRDADELTAGMVRGAIHASRGRLEAHLDPHSPHYRDEFDGAAEIVFYCATGSRSALAAHQAQQLDLETVAHLDGGFSGWVDVSGPIQVSDQSKSIQVEPRNKTARRL